MMRTLGVLKPPSAPERLCMTFHSVVCVLALGRNQNAFWGPLRGTKSYSAQEIHNVTVGELQHSLKY